MLDILFWAIIVALGLNTLLVVMSIGKRREPITPGSAVTIILMNAAIAAILIADHLR